MRQGIIVKAKLDRVFDAELMMYMETITKLNSVIPGFLENTDAIMIAALRVIAKSLYSEEEQRFLTDEEAKIFLIQCSLKDLLDLYTEASGMLMEQIEEAKEAMYDVVSDPRLDPFEKFLRSLEDK